ncbi:MAG: hypothetical protein JWQ09_1188 [Segetibacter sp.]|nr:hypothetical protein [Segetibacter sp.]
MFFFNCNEGCIGNIEVLLFFVHYCNVLTICLVIGLETALGVYRGIDTKTLNFMFKIYCCFTFLLGLLFSSDAYCQSASDSVFYNKAVNNIKATYFSTIQEKALLYNGIEYEYFGRGATGSPFFMVDTMHNGSVLYDGVLYEDVPMRYDMVNDILLVKYWRDNNTLQLIKNKVDYFSLLEHKFIRLSENEQNKGERPGFYELLYNDKKALVLAKRYKKLMLSSNPEDKSGSFVQYNQYFIYKDEKYSAVNSASDLAEIFKDKAQAIKKFIRSGNVKYKKNPEQAIITTALFYNGLSK